MFTALVWKLKLNGDSQISLSSNEKSKFMIGFKELGLGASEAFPENGIDEERSLSLTKIEQYSNCPMRFCAPIERLDVTPIDIGIVALGIAPFGSTSHNGKIFGSGAGMV